MFFRKEHPLELGFLLPTNNVTACRGFVRGLGDAMQMLCAGRSCVPDLT